jgi:hypothetical protein
MKIRNTVIGLLAFLLLSGVLMTTVSAEVWSPSLPTDPATIEITNPYTTPLCPSSYPFIIDLSNVGPGFDITDGTYTGWCTDVINGITRGVEYDVMLYSSYDEMAPIPSEDWNRINYIINNKQGTGCDVQAAIWYFINGGAYWWIAGDPFDPSVDSEVQNMVGDATTYGGTYEPGVGDILAIVCVPEDECAQTVIIELTVPPEGPGFTPGFWKHNIRVALGYPGDYSSFDDSGEHLTYEEVLGYVEATGLWGTGNSALEAALVDLTAKGPGSEMIRRDAANALNHAAGYGDYMDWE